MKCQPLTLSGRDAPVLDSDAVFRSFSIGPGFHVEIPSANFSDKSHGGPAEAVDVGRMRPLVLRTEAGGSTGWTSVGSPAFAST